MQEMSKNLVGCHGLNEEEVSFYGNHSHPNRLACTDGAGGPLDPGPRRPRQGCLPGAGVLMALAAFLLAGWLQGGGGILDLVGPVPVLDHLMLAGEFALMALIVVLCIRYKKYR